MNIGVLSLIVVAGIVVLFVVLVYNSLIRLENEVENSKAQIDVQLKRRFDLIPNLIDTVKGYVEHEKDVLKEVTEARTNFMEADEKDDMQKKVKADNQLESTLKSLFAVSEDYPDLKANENFLQLQEELSGTESKIAYARQHYNDVAMTFNNKIEVFPNNILADVFNFEEKQMLEIPEEERENVDVEFSE